MASHPVRAGMGTQLPNDLDPGDPRTPSQQIADALRAAILQDLFTAGDKLPSQHELVARYGVARETVKSALRILDREGLIASRQGAGSFVRARRGTHLDLPGLLRSAFERPDVTIDYAGFQGETLSKTLMPSLAEIRSGSLAARTVRIRMLLVDPARITDFPRRVDGRPIDRAVRAALTRITRTAVETIAAAVAGLARDGLLTSAEVQVRRHGLGPLMKCYLLNGERALIGMYPVTTYTVEVRGEQVPLLYPSGWDAVLMSSADAGTPAGRTSGPPFPEQAQQWFESIWSNVAGPDEIA